VCPQHIGRQCHNRPSIKEIHEAARDAQRRLHIAECRAHVGLRSSLNDRSSKCSVARARLTAREVGVARRRNSDSRKYPHGWVPERESEIECVRM